MLSRPSLVMRIAIGKAIGFIIGLSGFFMLSYLLNETDLKVRLGYLFRYTTVGR